MTRILIQELRFGTVIQVKINIYRYNQNMLKGLPVIGGIVFLLAIASIFGYYFLFIPYTVEVQNYNQQRIEYTNKINSCYEVAGLTPKCDSETTNCQPDDYGVVAGCVDLPKPVKPVLPLQDFFYLIFSKVFVFTPIKIFDMDGEWVK